MTGRAYLGSWCTEGSYQPSYYLGLQLLGKSLSYDLDVSGAGCGCNAALYLTPMNRNVKPSECGDYYCDAASVCGVRCAEIDIQEANNRAWLTTLHAEDDIGGMSQGYGTLSRQWNSTVYGPGARCIDTNRQFHVKADFPVDAAGQLREVRVTLSQPGSTCQLPISHRDYSPKGRQGGMAELSAVLAGGVTPIASYWGKGENLSWFDGPGPDQLGPCSGLAPPCRDSVHFDNFAVETLEPEAMEAEGLSLLDLGMHKKPQPEGSSAIFDNIAESLLEFERWVGEDALYSSGKFCTNVSYLFSGEDTACNRRCASTPHCNFFTTYGNTWCQLSASCWDQAEALDPTAQTHLRGSLSPPSCTDGRVPIVTGDRVLLLSRGELMEGRRGVLGTAGTRVQAEWREPGSASGGRQELVVERERPGPIEVGDTVFLRAYTGNWLTVQGDSVSTKYHDRGSWQALVIESKSGVQRVLSGDDVRLRAHTGEYVSIRGGRVLMSEQPEPLTLERAREGAWSKQWHEFFCKPHKGQLVQAVA